MSAPGINSGPDQQALVNLAAPVPENGFITGNEFECLARLDRLFFARLLAAEKFVYNCNQGFVWIHEGKGYPILTDVNEDKGVLRAIQTLVKDARTITDASIETFQSLKENRMIIIGTIGQSTWIQQLIASGKIDRKELEGKREKYLIQTIEQPFQGVDEAVVIAGSDKRGAIYGIYLLIIKKDMVIVELH